MAFVTANLPARSKGIELETHWQLIRGLSAQLTAAYNATQEDIAGQERQLTQAPRWTGYAALDYKQALNRALRWKVGADLRNRSQMFN